MNSYAFNLHKFAPKCTSVQKFGHSLKRVRNALKRVSASKGNRILPPRDRGHSAICPRARRVCDWSNIWTVQKFGQLLAWKYGSDFEGFSDEACIEYA